jgi:hypothetical protein
MYTSDQEEKGPEDSWKSNHNGVMDQVVGENRQGERSDDNGPQYTGHIHLTFV